MRSVAVSVFLLALAAASPALADEALEVTHDGVGTGVEKLRLKGRAESFPVGTKVFYWTRVIGGRPGDRIRHVWIHDGKEISIGLALGGHHWRTYSSKRIGLDQAGEWSVEARDKNGKVLSRRKFACTEE